MKYITNIDNFEDYLIDDSNEYNEMNDYLDNKKFTFDNIVKLYKKHFISKMYKDLDFSYAIIRNFERAYISNQEILDRNIFILKSKILHNLSNKEIADRYSICSTTVSSLYKKMLKDLKNIIQKTYLQKQ
jgi:hypothetical protein